MARIALVGPARSRFRAALGNLEGHQLVAQPVLARSALVELQNHQIDLLVVLLELPDIHGLELAGMLKRNGQLTAETPVLVCSTLNSAMNIQRAMRYGASGFLLMKDSPDLLEHVIDAVFEGGAIFPEHPRLPLEEDRRLRDVLELSPQYIAVLHGLRCGHSPRLLADLLETSMDRIGDCKRQLMRKLKVSSLDDLIGASREIGLI